LKRDEIMNTSVTNTPELRNARAIEADLASNLRISLSGLWCGLVAGEYRVVDGFFTLERCYLVFAKRQDKGETLSGRRLEILMSVLTGQCQKRVAIDLALAPSTVALNARLALESLGVGDRPSRAHPLLMLAARAFCEADKKCCGSLSQLRDGEDELQVVSVPRPDHRLTNRLPPAELDVVRRLIEGLPYSDIARQRGTSMRTVANQITAVFRRMKVSGRNDLLMRLFSDDGQAEQSNLLSPPPVPPPVPPSAAPTTLIPPPLVAAEHQQLLLELARRYA
jgi:DNA-binding NarL/FixJ family response regulator